MSDDLALTRLKGAHIAHKIDVPSEHGHFGNLQGIYWDPPQRRRASKRLKGRSGYIVVSGGSLGADTLEETVLDVQAETAKALGSYMVIVDDTAEFHESDVASIFVAPKNPAVSVKYNARAIVKALHAALNDKLVRAELRLEARSSAEFPHIEVSWTRSTASLRKDEEAARVEPAIFPAPHPPSDFVPSSDLVAFWRRGLEAHKTEARRGVKSKQPVEVWENQTTDELARAFSIRLRRMFSIIGNRERHGIESYKVVGSAGRFSLGVQYQILDRIQIRPDESTDFFSSLYAELAQYLSCGGRLGGSWGDLVLRDSKFEIITKPEPANEGQWEPAEVLE